MQYNKPSIYGYRYLILKPTMVGDIDVDITINDIWYEKLDAVPDNELFRFKVSSKFNGSFRIKIHLNRGKLIIDRDSAFGYYPSLLKRKDQIEGWAYANQMYNVLWMQNPSKKPEGSTITIEEGETFEYDLLCPNGPEWLEFLNLNDNDLQEFKTTKIITKEMMSRNESSVVIHADYPVIDKNLTVKERTKNLIKLIGN
jgi:hypothetical protein